MSEQKKDELQFPMEFKKCPVCGSEERVAQKVFNEEVAAGRAKAQLAGMFRFQTVVVDAQGLVSRITPPPALIAHVDVCANPDCGCVYCFMVQKGKAAMQQPGFPGGPGGPGGLPGIPGFGRG